MSMTQKETGNYDWAMRRVLQLEAEVTELSAHNELQADTIRDLSAKNRLLSDLVHGVETVTTPKPKAPKLRSVKA